MQRLIRETSAIVEVELIKLIRDPTELLSRAIQPLLWLVVFGQVLAQVRGIHTGQVNYLAFITPGILAQSILFSSIFYGIAIIWERDLGVVHKLLVSPAWRASLVFGKAIAAGFRGLIQTIVIYLIALVMHVSIRLDPLAILAVAGSVMLGAGIFATFSLVIACIVKTRERFMGIGQVLTMPMFFASNAIYPLDIMPHWLRLVARINPLTYLIDALRGLVITNGTSVYGFRVDFSVLIGIFAGLLFIAVKLYPSLAE
ncbi:ABC transporter permease [Sulfuriferula nivalis]|uniref:Transport permease protein n=1 Tax=Sulfuriferula nivalis TaxID=2675298 RepID=A0A809SB18_9PROT|nr:ABC transporter permease [Sulfuriferula nivalis]BBP02403.1 transport permease protein [Sulfuriferula nivalis]